MNMTTRALWLVLAACSSGPRPDWDPPPAAAVARCVYGYESSADEYGATTTWHFDDRGKVVQIDSFGFDDELVRFSMAITYDAEGRLVHQTFFDGDHQYAYYPDYILRTAQFGPYRMQDRFELDDRGRIVRVHGPLHRPEDQQTSWTYEYDADGRITREQHVTSNGVTSDERYTYDELGRLLTRAFDEEGFHRVAYNYTATGTSLRIDDCEEYGCDHEWFVEYDDQRRLRSVRSETAEPYGSLQYIYGPDSFEEREGTRTLLATGACPQPQIMFAPRPPRIEPTASGVRRIAPVLPQFLFADEWR